MSLRISLCQKDVSYRSFNGYSASFAVIGGFGKGVGDMMLEGLKQVAPSAAMLLFAILYFGVMIDAGLFDPLIKQLLKS